MFETFYCDCTNKNQLLITEEWLHLCTVIQGCIVFTTFSEQLQNSMPQESDGKQVPNWVFQRVKMSAYKI